MNVYAGINVPEPADMIVYFYAGNDVSNELSSVARDPQIDLERISDRTYASQVIAKAGADGIKRVARRWYFLRNAHLLDTMAALAKLLWKNVRADPRDLLLPDDRWLRLLVKTGDEYRADWSRYAESGVRAEVGGAVGRYPRDSIEPVAFYTASEIDVAASLLEATLEYFRDLFPHTRLWVAYIPSPINAYKLLEDTVMLHDRIETENQTVAGPLRSVRVVDLLAASDRLCRAIEAAATEAGARLIDTRSYLRKASAQRGYLHGPNDSGHFNQAGYTALAEILRDALAGGGTGTCSLIGG